MKLGRESLTILHCIVQRNPVPVVLIEGYSLLERRHLVALLHCVCDLLQQEQLDL